MNVELVVGSKSAFTGATPVRRGNDGVCEVGRRFFLCLILKRVVIAVLEGVSVVPVLLFLLCLL